MKSRTLATAAVALAGIAVGATLVQTVTFGRAGNAGYSSSTASPAPQSTAEYVFACVNTAGKIDYLEFRTPLPLQCWFSGETLWHFAALPAVQAVSASLATRRSCPVPGADHDRGQFWLLCIQNCPRS